MKLESREDSKDKMKKLKTKFVNIHEERRQEEGPDSVNVEGRMEGEDLERRVSSRKGHGDA